MALEYKDGLVLVSCGRDLMIVQLFCFGSEATANGWNRSIGLEISWAHSSMNGKGFEKIVQKLNSLCDIPSCARVIYSSPAMPPYLVLYTISQLSEPNQDYAFYVNFCLMKKDLR